ncbi:hypothetical protein [Mesorhizobium sp.]|uniref:hypothetical protein n=1 Tax=Mesorhizobium sp. TaxID=1871066 RepID=UPI000FE89156|nr:hypothetical protein [Mesorhizobium sp.]RWD71371.1 MAG: hypothetical protein EOS37_11690 [Mesorhizobium sp.]TIV61133.1 MAG: hypothetical protein E5V80_06090 [Mesorhizobium sp.]
MASQQFDVPRVRDRDVFKFFIKIGELIGAQTVNFSEVGAYSPTSLQLSDQAQMAGSYFSESDLFSIYEANTNANNGNFSVNLTRLASGPDGVTDRLSINNGQKGSVGPEVPHQINALISETFVPGPEPFVGLFHNQKTFTTLIKSHQNMLAQLQSTATKVTENIAEAHTRLEQEFAKRAAQLDEDLQKRAAKLEETVEAERKALREREHSLTIRSRDLDERDNTTARRAQHATLKSRIAERGNKFVITQETKRARWPIHISASLACAVILGFLIYYASAITSLPADASVALIIAASVKPVGLTIALLGLVAWYLRWMNRWFERHADAEFYLKQFELDIDRANWVVETALEWKEKQEKAIPDGLLDSISRNLFIKSERDEDADMHPADYLASAILGRASGVTLKLPGAEVAMTGKDIRKLQKDDAA